MKAKLSAVVITRDEEKNIGQCLEGLAFCDETVVVDSGSRDRTVPLARALGAVVYENAFRDFASQKNAAISKARYPWVLLIDADERVSPALAVEIRAVLQETKAEGYTFRRENRIFGRRMRHGANAHDRQLRLVRKEKAFFEGAVHERIFLQGKIGCLKNPLSHDSTPTLRDYMRKLNVYTALEAGAMAEGSVEFSEKKLKQRPLLLFFYQHFFRRGFLDGLEGFLFNGLSAYYEFVRYAKRWELDNRERAAE